MALADHNTQSSLDLTLYLVTDSTPAIPGPRDLVDVVEEAIKGGVTIVQYRDKHSDTDILIKTAKKLHKITRRHKIPLLINDRVDVAVVVGAEGVHLGQDDMHISEARNMLGDEAIIGISVSNMEEAENAFIHGADYLGIGTMFPTPTKADTKSVIGTAGTHAILDAISVQNVHCLCVAIGSINSSNVQRVLHQCSTSTASLAGVAVVSAIMASADPQSAARKLRHLIHTAPDTIYSAIPVSLHPPTSSLSDLLSLIPSIVHTNAFLTPLAHNMTNTVVQHFSANVLLALGASPIMSLSADEAPALARIPHSSLLLNTGTLTPDTVSANLTAFAAYNALARPVVLDPVGCGATPFRQANLRTMLQSGFFDLIKGNESEITAPSNITTSTSPSSADPPSQQRGVDSNPFSTSTPATSSRLVSTLAQQHRTFILLTGATDYLSDGTRTLALSNGHPFQAAITGSGCALGSVLASFLAAWHGKDKLAAVLAGCVVYGIAAERAAARCRGPGSFAVGFVDELFALRQETMKEKGAREEWVKEARVEWVDGK